MTVHFEGKSSEYLCLDIERFGNILQGCFGDNNSPLLFISTVMKPDVPAIENMKKFMAELWVLYGLKCANQKSAAYNNYFHAWWQLECYKRLRIDPPHHPSELADVVCLECGYIDMHKRIFHGPATQTSVPVDLQLGHMPDYETLAALNRK